MTNYLLTAFLFVLFLNTAFASTAYAGLFGSTHEAQDFAVLTVKLFAKAGDADSFMLSLGTKAEPVYAKGNKIMQKLTTGLSSEEAAKKAMSRLLNIEFGKKALENWGDESIEGLAKAADKGFLQVAERISTKYGNDIAEIIGKGINRGVIEADDELMYRLADYTKAMRKAGFGADPLELANEHRVVRLMKSKDTSVIIGSEPPIRNTAVLKKGVPEQWGHDHIFSYIRPGQSTTRAQQVLEAFPDSMKNKDDIMKAIQETIKSGEKFEPTKVRKLYQSKNGEMRYFEVWLDDKGSIGTIVP